MDKIKAMLTSRRFWATALVVAGVWGAYLTGALTIDKAMIDTVAAISAYVVSLGIS